MLLVRILYIAFIFIAFAVPAMALSSSVSTNTSINATTPNAYTIPTISQSIQISPYDLKWSASLGASRAEDSLSNQKSQVNLGFKLIFDMKMNDWMNLNLIPKASIQNGYVQATDVVDPKGNRIEIINAAIDLKPTTYFLASVGALNQHTHHDDLFMSERAFPSIRLQIGNDQNEKSSNIKSQSNKFYVFIEDAMPTSSSLSNNSNDLNQTPNLISGGIGTELMTASKNFSFQALVAGFQYSSLPTTISTASVILGNSGVNTTGQDYKFKYEFQGVEAKAAISLRTSNTFEFQAEGAYLQNASAPSGLNSAWVGRAEARWDFSKKLQLIPNFEYFRVESDATVSAFNNSLYNTNRIGYLGGIIFKYSKIAKFSFSAGKRTALLENPSQPNENVYYITVETDNAQI